MKRDWIKLNLDILDDPLYGTLTDDLWRLVIQLNLLAGETNREGLLPSVRDMAWMLHVGLGTLQISLHQLAERGLVHSTPQGWVVAGFKESQAAPNSTERSRAFRRRRKTETQPEAGDLQAGPDVTKSATEDATPRQPARPETVAPGVPAPDRSAPKRRQRHRSRPGSVEKAVDKAVDTCPVNVFPQEKGRKNSDPRGLSP